MPSDGRPVAGTLFATGPAGRFGGRHGQEERMRAILDGGAELGEGLSTMRDRQLNKPAFSGL